MLIGGVVLHPRRALGAAAAAPSLAHGGGAVAASGIAILALDLAASMLGGAGPTAVILSLLAPLTLGLYWLGSGLLMSAGARLMGEPRRRRPLLAVTGLTFPALTLYALIALLQTVSLRWGAPALAAVAGWLYLPVLLWFVGLTALAVAAVYEIAPLSAIALALLPNAALSLLILLLVLVISALRAAGLA